MRDKYLLICHYEQLSFSSSTLNANMQILSAALKKKKSRWQALVSSLALLVMHQSISRENRIKTHIKQLIHFTNFHSDGLISPELLHHAIKVYPRTE